jgi:DUF3047 family protein
VRTIVALATLLVVTGSASPPTPPIHLGGIATAEAQTSDSSTRPQGPLRRRQSRAAREEAPAKAPGPPAAPVAVPAPAPAPAPDVPYVEDSRADPERRPRPPGAIVVPRGGSGPAVTVPLTDSPALRLGRGELPPAWDLRRFAGRPQFELAREDGRPVFRLASQAASFALHRDVAVDLGRYPMLTWSWKVTRLPARGDVRAPETNDQAAQLYLVFPRTPSPRTSSDVLGYVWDTQAPAGQRATNPRWGNVRVIVLESGARRAGTWVREERNARQDYIELFGKEPPTLGKVALMTDSDHTRGQSEAFFQELRFTRPEASSPSQPRAPN